jgi:uncharacterized protein
MNGDPVTSRYTFRVAVTGGYALYNANSGSTLLLTGADAEDLSTLLSSGPVAVAAESLGPELTTRLRRTGFLHDPGFDELAAIQQRYWAARGSTPVSLVITTTMDCNLGCYYCFEERTADALAVHDADAVVRVAAERLRGRNRPALHVDWYGGEPLMNVEFLERTSLALQEFCASEGIRYYASIVSNGTRWPDDVGGFVARHRIRQAQISFDGMRSNHNRRRRYRAGYRQSPSDSAFDRAVDLVDLLVTHTRVDLRFNADRGNAEDLPAFIALAHERGWFDAPFRCVLVVAKLSAYSDRSKFLRPHELDDECFEELQRTVREQVPAGSQDQQDVVAGLPHPRTSVCGALADDSAVLGADGLEYRCGLQVGERHRAVGTFRPLLPLISRSEQFADRSWWSTFDPTTVPTCSRCSFLPLCWGGCPKRHLEDDGTDAEGRFWRANLPRMIADGLGRELVGAQRFDESEQFRE